MDWQAFFFSSQEGWSDRLLRMSRKRFPRDEVLAEEAYTFVLERLSEDAWRRLGAFQGMASPATFLTTCMRNALEDFSHKRFGKPRPPAWLKSLGGLWLEVYNSLCMERLAENAIIDRTISEMRRTAEDVRNIIRTIRGRVPQCGNSQHYFSLDEKDNDDMSRIPELEDKGAQPDVLATRARIEQTMFALARLLGSGGSVFPVPKNLSLTVSDEETVLLRLVYVDGMKPSEAARALGEPEHTVRRALQRCFKRLKEEMGDDLALD